MSNKTIAQRRCCCKSWQFRNDSSNMAAVLNPVFFEPDDHICYCHEKRIPPRLFPKPKECIFITDEDAPTVVRFPRPFSSKAGSGAFKVPQYSKSSEKTLKYLSKSDKYLSETDDLKTYKIKSKSSRGLTTSGENLFEDEDFARQKTESSLKTNGKSKTNTNSSYFDKQRKQHFTVEDIDALSPTSSFANESKYQEDERDKKYGSQPTHTFKHSTTKTATNGVSLKEKHKKSEAVLEEEIGYRKSQETEGREKYRFKESSLPEFTEYDSKLPLSNLATAGDISTQSDLKGLSDFRKDHFFETHSTEDLIKPIPEHICVHRFGLDDRLLPQPLYADVYGASRCIICDRLMDSPPLNKIDERTLRTKNILPKFYKYGLAPKKIYMGNDEKVKIEMKLDCKDENFVMKTQKPNYFNTYALRYQKGVA